MAADLKPIHEYIKAIEKELIAGNATEHTHRPALKALVEGLTEGVTATNEPTHIECGAPDFVVTKGVATIGYIEAKDVGMRLLKLYDALETGRLSLDDLAPRIRELKARQDELSKTKVVALAEMMACGIDYVDYETVKAYAADLRNLLEEADITESKAFLRSFVKRIVIDGEKVTIQYNLPLPPETRNAEQVEVLPTVTPWWSWGDSNPLPFDCQSNVLPSELQPRKRIFNLAQKGAVSKGGEYLASIETNFRDVYARGGDIYASFTFLVLSLCQNVRN